MYNRLRCRYARGYADRQGHSMLSHDCLHNHQHWLIPRAWSNLIHFHSPSSSLLPIPIQSPATQRVFHNTINQPPNSIVENCVVEEKGAGDEEWRSWNCLPYLAGTRVRKAEVVIVLGFVTRAWKTSTEGSAKTSKLASELTTSVSSTSDSPYTNCQRNYSITVHLVRARLLSFHGICDGSWWNHIWRAMITKG